MALAASYQQHARQYQRTQAETARPTQLVVMLYDGAIRFLVLAKEGMKQKNIEIRHVNLVKAQNIIMELMSSLNREQGGEISVNLHRIYQFMLEQLVEANIYDREMPINSVLQMLRDLRESWAEVDRIEQKKNASGGLSE
jgi:flagellar protein FliS